MALHRERLYSPQSATRLAPSAPPIDLDRRASRLPPSDPWKRSDERILEELESTFRDDAYLDATRVEIAVERGVATLRGVVESEDERKRAEELAFGVPGVEDVVDLLRVGER